MLRGKRDSRDELDQPSFAKQVKSPAIAPEKRPLLVNPFGPEQHLFEDTMLDRPQMAQPKRLADMAVAFVFQGLLIAILVLVPLYFTEAIDLGAYNTTYLAAPPPPPAPP